jgi:diguanylate cyclase (GGDEF)-like protein
LGSKKTTTEVFSRVNGNTPSNDGAFTELFTINQALMALYHASSELQLSKPLPALLKSILRGLKSGTGIDRAAIFLNNTEQHLLQGAAAIGLNEKKTSELSLPFADNWEEALLSMNNLTSLKEPWPSEIESLKTAIEQKLECHSLGLLPLEMRDQLLGVVAFSIPEIYPKTEILAIFARQAAMTIENAQLFSKVEEMALRDTLTGLYNRRYFQQILDYELNRAKRYRQPLSLVFIDLDHFKEINDQFGHSVGDQFLRQIALKLSSMFRTTDLVARYAGDEFIAILPTTHHEGAMILARRILEQLGSYQIMVRGKTLQVSVSVGVDTYEGLEGVGSVGFIDRADKAMYVAKAQGRNRVKSYLEIAKTAVS